MRTATLDIQRITELSEALRVPLVLHGSSGVADPTLRAAVEAGMTKINISTHLNYAMTQRVRHYLAVNPTAVDPRKYIGEGRQAVTTEVIRLMRVMKAV